MLGVGRDAGIDKDEDQNRQAGRVGQGLLGWFRTLQRLLKEYYKGSAKVTINGITRVLGLKIKRFRVLGLLQAWGLER